MRDFGPRSLTLQDGRDWLIQAWRIIWRRPGLFVTIAVLAPMSSALLLALPFWEGWLTPTRGEVTLVATLFCYGLPLSLTVVLACGLARAANRKQKLALVQLLNRTVVKALARTSFFLFLLLLQGYLLAYWFHNQWVPTAAPITGDSWPSARFGVTDTILGTQLSFLGSTLLILQMLLVVFVIPLQLFWELPWLACWRSSILAIQLNPWLFPVLGLVGLPLLVLPFLEIFSIPAQILALPLPVYLGVLLYVAWNDVFQAGADEETLIAVPDQQAHAPLNAEPISRH